MSEDLRVASVRLLIVADDYGYSPAYDRGILRAARAGAIDAAGAMVARPWCDPAPLLETGVEVGLHFESEGASDPAGALGRQLDRFERLFGRPPAYIDGHHHCHARPDTVAAVAAAAADLGARVRSVDECHRTRLRADGVITADRLVGRVSEDEEALPAEIAAVLRGEPAPPGTTEWMVHPGEADPAAESSYDAARAEDLELLIRLAADPALGGLRDSTSGS